MKEKDGINAQPDVFEEFNELIGQGVDHQISPREGVVGRQLDPEGPILSPRTFNQNYLE